ncbi:MAG: DUF3793 family protein [Clostridia bacterium]|nr:DUF3793 family protein [Clostridia bacterium]
MSEETVIRCCAPTLAAIKTGSLFNYPFESREELTESLRMVNRCLIHKDVRAFPLRYQNGRALIYLYRPQMLERDLQNPVAEDILQETGYPKGKAIEKIAYLIRRLRECDSFPHEIGLFLGYPAVDVKGFIEHKECKCTGLWKVFESDETEAQRYFARCRRCTEGYLRRKQEGWDLSRLTIQPRQFSYKSIA